jgi:hypothetical protein
MTSCHNKEAETVDSMVQRTFKSESSDERRNNLKMYCTFDDYFGSVVPLN